MFNYNSYLWAVQTLNDDSANRKQKALASLVITSYLGSHSYLKECYED